MFYGRTWKGVSIDGFISRVGEYIHWYNENRIKISLGGLESLEHRLKIAIFLAIISVEDKMTIDTRDIISITSVNQNFSAATKLADKRGRAIIFKNNKPKYMLLNLDQSPVIEMTDDEKIEFVASRILKKYKAAFQELAK